MSRETVHLSVAFSWCHPNRGQLLAKVRLSRDVAAVYADEREAVLTKGLQLSIDRNAVWW